MKGFVVFFVIKNVNFYGLVYVKYCIGFLFVDRYSTKFIFQDLFKVLKRGRIICL